MGKMCYRCMAPTVEGGVCTRCGEPELKATGNGDNALAPGTSLGKGRLTVGKKLGSGGFGVTYIAFDSKLNRRVALKEFMPNYLAVRQGVRIVPKPNQEAAYEKAMNSFQKEARAMYELRAHPNIVHVISTFKENNTAYYTMEMLDGESLLSYLKKKKKISADQAFRLLLPIMGALQYVHSKKILHRDVSPDNVMLCEDKAHPGKIVPKLIDFGAAHVAIEGFSMSYPGVKKNGFSPLEQNWAGNYQGPWTDVYALCATFYSAIIGAVPISAAERAEADRDPMKPPEAMGAKITPEMSAVLMHGLKLKYQERIQTMNQLIRDMTAAANKSGAGVTVSDQIPEQGRGPKRPLIRRILAWLLEKGLAVGAMAALTPELFDAVSAGKFQDLLGLINTKTLMIPAAFFVLDLLLLLTAGSTLGQLLFGLKTQKDDGAGRPGFFQAAGYALCYNSFGWPIALLCGIIWLLSGKDIGPMEGMLNLTVTGRGGQDTGGMSGAAVISRSVNAAALVSGPAPEVLQQRAQAPRSGVAAAQPASGAPRPASGAPRPASAAPRPASGAPRPASAAPRPASGAPRPASGAPGQAKPSSGPSAMLLCRGAAETAKELNGRALTIQAGDTLGKNTQRARIVIPDQTVSGLHCSFAFLPQRGWVVKDENSTNGTFVNDIKLPAGGSAPLRDGAILKVGKESFEFKAKQ